jgi:hypothetical protein
MSIFKTKLFPVLVVLDREFGIPAEYKIQKLRKKRKEIKIKKGKKVV